MTIHTAPPLNTQLYIRRCTGIVGIEEIYYFRPKSITFKENIPTHLTKSEDRHRLATKEKNR